MRYSWYLEPLDSHINEVLARELPEECFARDMLCDDGQARNLWLCPSKLVYFLWQSKITLGINFRIFNAGGRGGRIESKPRELTFLFKILRSRRREKVNSLR